MAPITARASLRATRLELARTRAEVQRLNQHLDQARRELAATRLDPLTGLSTRATWLAQASRFISTVDNALVLLLDLNGFKEVNDAYGHACGDALLKIQGQRLALWARERGHAGRLGGDELVAVVELDKHEVERELTSLGSMLSKPLVWDSRLVHATAAIGVAVAAGHELDVLMAAADCAMYRAKVGQLRGWWRWAQDEEYTGPEAAPVHRPRHRDHRTPTSAL